MHTNELLAGPTLYDRRTLICASSFALLGLSGCTGQTKPVIIFAATEGMRNEALLRAMREDLPDVDVRLKYMSTGNLAARLAMEGEGAECDIVLGLEAGYLMAAADSLVDLSGEIDFSDFEDDLVIDTRIMPFTREAGCFAYNPEVLARAGATPPKSMDDLLDSRFRGLVCAPDPASSSTGYNLLCALANRLGDVAAIEWMKAFSENVYQFTSSGGAPASALTQGEAGIGLSPVFTLVAERSGGSPLEILRFPEGSPWTANGASIVSGHDRPEVRRVFRWLYEKGILLDKERFVPDRVLKDQDTHIDGWPEGLAYADMTGLFDLDRKERLLDAWKELGL